MKPGLPPQLPLGMMWSETASFESYSPVDNAETVAAVHRLAEGGNTSLLLHGGQATGKTHLLQAAARYAHRLGSSAAYLPLSVYAKTTPEVLQGFTHLRLIALDECESVWMQRDWATALARLLDSQREQGGGLLLASRSAPTALAAEVLPDLRTRLSACAVYGLRPLSDHGRRDALQRHARTRGLNLDDGVADYLIQRLPRDSGSLLAALDTLDTLSLSAKRRLTIPFVRQFLDTL